MLIIVQNEANETFAPRTFSPEKSSLNARARRRRRGKRDHALAFVIYRRERVLGQREVHRVHRGGGGGDRSGGRIG